MIALERVHPFLCPHCLGSGTQTHYDSTPTNFNPFDHTYHGIGEPEIQTHNYPLPPDWDPCSLCKGRTRIWLTQSQLEPDHLAAMGLMLVDDGPQIRNVTIQPRNKTEKRD